MMNTHIVCLDGTNQYKTQPHPTNISYIYDSVGGTSQAAGFGSFERTAAGIAGKYLPGVGAQGSATLRVLGNLFGDGIAELLIRGYTYLSRSFSPGDQIILTGFSRGATAARALGGLLVTQGLLDPGKYDSTDRESAYKRAIAAWYLYRQDQPKLANQDRIPFLVRILGMLPRLVASDFSPPLDVAAIGVFDTVSSLGVPHLDGSEAPMYDFSICDTTLSPKVANGFHALAADELRELFVPTFWQERARIEQQIFPGSHSNVGGSYPERGLSDCALEWMMDKLNSIKPIFDLGKVNGFAPSPLDTARNEALVFPFSATPRRARVFPKTTTVPSATLHARFLKTCDIVPGSGPAPYLPEGHYADGSALLP